VTAGDLEGAAARLREVRLELAARAREDPVVFLAYVMRDEKTGAHLALSPDQIEWQDVISEHERVVIWAHPEAGKTSAIAVGRVLWELGRNPSAAAAIVSSSESQSTKILGLIAKYIESSAELHEVFPDLVPADPWTTTHITVKRPHMGKDYSVQVLCQFGRKPSVLARLLGR
jgi:hypothetical protein